MSRDIKQIILGAFIVVFGALSWLFLYQLLYFGNSAIVLILTILGFLFFGISLGIGSSLITNSIILYSAFALGLLSFLIFFRGAKETIYYLIVLILTFASLFIYQRRVKYEEKARIKLHFWRIFKKGLPLVFTLICILVSLAYYFSPLLGEIKVKLAIPRSLFDVSLKPIEGLIQEKLPQGINLGSELDTIVPPDQKKDIERQFGIKIEKGDTGRDIIYKLSNAQINNFGGSYKKYIPIALAVGLFFALRIFSILLVAFIVLFSYFVVKILISTGFAKIVTKSVEMEDIEI